MGVECIEENEPGEGVGFWKRRKWRVPGITRAITSVDRGEGVSHRAVKNWGSSWDPKREQSAPKRSAK